MSDAAIHVAGLTKRYRVWTHHRPTSLKERLSLVLPGRPMQQDDRRPHREEVWALQDVSFDVSPGEVFGVIGANGAGKSTLLAILARVTEPTAGLAEIRGRVSSLLEVGTGFHAELSGRDNVFLNGAVLGMSRAETRRKYDEIVAFAELDEFMDMPVKRYSTGMYMRLAFAIAAHLDPEILLLDEVLSVGDAAFQEKSIARVREMTRAGRTVLFVSHQTTAVAQLCDRALYLKNGRNVFLGPVEEALERYLSSSRLRGGSLAHVEREGSGEVRFSDVRITNIHGEERVYADQPIHVSLSLSTFKPLSPRDVAVVLSINSPVSGTMLVVTSRLSDVFQDANVVPEGGTILCQLDELPLRPGPYFLSFAITRGADLIDHVSNSVEFDLLPPAEFVEEFAGPFASPVYVGHTWRAAEGAAFHQLAAPRR